jgi:hypothetical protein
MCAVSAIIREALTQYPPVGTKEQRIAVCREWWAFIDGANIKTKASGLQKLFNLAYPLRQAAIDQIYFEIHGHSPYERQTISAPSAAENR